MEITWDGKKNEGEMGQRCGDRRERGEWRDGKRNSEEVTRGREGKGRVCGEGR